MTEPDYFNHLNALMRNTVILEFVDPAGASSASDPASLLKKINQYLKTASLKGTDEAWIVCDRDRWSEAQLDEIYKWAQQPNHGMALTNPKFEYWLLLHFENGNGLKSIQDCDQRLAKHLPNYKKKIDTSKFTEQAIRQAIARAEQRPKTTGSWPQSLGETQVHILVKKILKG